jgi:hypothetical protein
MCSQRLTRPGKLCRECEQELDRARLADASAGDLALTMPSGDEASQVAEFPAPHASTRLRVRLVVAAFSIGLAGAAALYIAHRPTPPQPADSVMLDRDVSAVTPRLVAPKRERGDIAPAAVPLRAATRARAVALVSAPKPGAEHAFDRVLALSDALTRCEHETFFERIACEHRARTRYCDGAAGQGTQCVDDTPRDHGQ